MYICKWEYICTYMIIIWILLQLLYTSNSIRYYIILYIHTPISYLCVILIFRFDANIRVHAYVAFALHSSGRVNHSIFSQFLRCGNIFKALGSLPIYMCMCGICYKCRDILCRYKYVHQRGNSYYGILLLYTYTHKYTTLIISHILHYKR